MSRQRSPIEKFAVEIRAVLDRWADESDLSDIDMAEAAAKVINDWLDEDFMIFEADEDLDGEPA